jgi:drug/metabolite transporter (DMT)-like permease
VINRYVALALLVQVVFSTMPSASKFIITEMPVEPYIAWRWSISALIFSMISMYKKIPWNLSKRELGLISLMGILGYGGASLGTLYGLKWGGVSFFGLMTLFNPVLVTAMSVLILKEKITSRTLAAIMLALVGVALTIKGKEIVSDGARPLLAGFVIVMAYIFDSIIFLKSKKYREKISLIQYMCIAQAAAALFMWILSFSIYPFDQLYPHSRYAWLGVGYVASVSCCLGFFLWYWLLGHLKGQQLGFYQYAHGIFAAFLGALIFKEVLSAQMLLGGVFFFLSILWVSRRPKRV